MKLANEKLAYKFAVLPVSISSIFFPFIFNTVIAVSIFLNYAAITAGTGKCPRMKSFLETGNFSTFPTHHLVSWTDPVEMYIISTHYLKSLIIRAFSLVVSVTLKRDHFSINWQIYHVWCNLIINLSVLEYHLCTWTILDYQFHVMLER